MNVVVGEGMAARLKAQGIPGKQITVITIGRTHLSFSLTLSKRTSFAKSGCHLGASWCATPAISVGRTMSKPYSRQ